MVVNHTSFSVVSGMSSGVPSLLSVESDSFVVPTDAGFLAGGVVVGNALSWVGVSVP